MASTTRGVDKSGYHLFNPTPHRLMRPLAGDRPDVTETPFTVDAGHLLVETGLVNYRQDDEGGKESEALSVLNQTNLRLGLLNSTELQMIASIYSNQETEFPRAGTQRLEGFSDLTFRLKQNLWGNDTGRVAVAAKPFLKVPTGTELSNNAFEGGFTMIAGTALGKLGRLTSQIQPRWVFDEAEENHDTELGHTVSWSLNLVGDLGGYLEYVGTVNTDSDTDYQATFSTGLIQNLSKDVALDLGTRLGMTEAAQDLVVFTGMITRF